MEKKLFYNLLLILGLFLVSESFYAQNPGGVTGTNLWLKANAGTTNSGSDLTGWTDQTGTNTFAVNGTPGFQTNAINFNPIVSFDNTDANTVLPTNRLDGNTPISYVDGFAVFKKNAADSGVLLGNVVDPIVNYGMAIFSGFNGDDLWIGAGGQLMYQKFTNPLLDPSSNKCVIVNMDVSLPTSPYSTATLNGEVQTLTPTGEDLNNSYALTPMIGGTYNGTVSTVGFKYFRGDVAEMISFPSSLSSTDKSKVVTYLAIKYGISLATTPISSPPYRNSNGTEIRPADFAHPYDIFGIGKDDNSGLNQTTSNSINTGSGNGTGQSGKGNIVLGAASSLDNGDFLLVGHDNGGLTEQTTDLPNSLTGKKRLAREWKVNHTGDVGTVDFSFSTLGLSLTGTNASDFKLLIDTDGNGDFTNGTVTIVDASSYSGNNLIFNSLSLSNNAIFTFVTGNDSSLSTSTFDLNQLVLYPNPLAKGKSQEFILKGIANNATVVLNNALGQKLSIEIERSENIYKIKPTKQLSSGVYFVTVSQDGVNSQIKLIVE